MRLAAFPLTHEGVLIMAKKRMVMELGMGSSLRQQDYTRAACRAVEDALWHNSLSIADAFGLDRSAMIIEVEIGVQQPEKVDTDKVAAILPYGSNFTTRSGLPCNTWYS